MQPLRWSPPAGIVVLAWIGAAGAAAWCVLLVLSHADPAGRLLSGVAAVSLLGAAVFGTVARPRLAADASGVTVRGLGAPQHHPWSRVPGIRVLRTRRFGRETPLLELDVVGEDGRERLLVFGRLDLGDDPEDVGDRLIALRAR
ncbi:PH domain-containing protein [Pseudonocardia sp. H11422]|uniref:PH domain-containing protein n=1 Tax=Pseudonocardia sp. H11422 TaxID=2835866 RepID=UPI001BDC84C0|nr:PH domain-containing protein [Pseudonocardia sp. H11422]